MSRIGRKAVAVDSGVTVQVNDSVVTVKGAKGELKYCLLPEVTVTVDGNSLVVERKGALTKQASARHGLTRQIIQNMIIGVSRGYEKQLEIIGVGYKAQPTGRKLVLNLGHSHPIDYHLPNGVTVAQDEKNKNILIITGIDKQLVGQVAADIRSYRPPEPYKGKGVRYRDEKVRRKAGKAAAKAAA